MRTHVKTSSEPRIARLRTAEIHRSSSKATLFSIPRQKLEQIMKAMNDFPTFDAAEVKS